MQIAKCQAIHSKLQPKGIFGRTLNMHMWVEGDRATQNFSNLYHILEEQKCTTSSFFLCSFFIERMNFLVDFISLFPFFNFKIIP
jgi:hypothetical protein